MTFLETLNAAKDTHNPDEYIARVKRVVKDELFALDSTSVVESTPYFNHTAVPDFVVSWPNGTSKRTSAKREVFLRHSYRSISDDGDEKYLGGSDAIVLSLKPSMQTETESEAVGREALPTTTRLLVTDTEALQVVASQVGQEGLGPLAGLIRANFVRGAKGRIDPPTAARLVELDQAGGNEAMSAAGLIANSFVEDAAARITRTAQLIDLALGNPIETPALIGGRLSVAELRHLLPWLLKQGAESVQPAFWAYIGTLIDFKELESIRDSLIDLDLTPLVKANSRRWSARRAYVGLAISDDATGEPARAPGRWGFTSGTLSAISIDHGSKRLYLAQGGALLKPRPSTSSAVWDRVHLSVGDMRLRRVELRGIRRSVSVNAEQSPDIQSDVDEITRSLDDQYFVDGVTLRVLAPGDQDGTVDLDVQFGESLIVAQSDVSIADLTRVALGVLEYRDPSSSDDINNLLGESENS